jgi:riboflavin biosynthesis pyrimidine reductase
MRDDSSDFASFVRRKEAAAGAATLERFRTIADNSKAFALETISTPFTDALLDGSFFQSRPQRAHRPSVNVIFVQSRDGNTVAEDPSSLGGGDTDQHVIYEGLSRVSADAVAAGSKTVGDGNRVFSIWHPELVKLRLALGMRRHPLQIVLTKEGALPVESGLMFNVPEVPVIVVCNVSAASRLAPFTAPRPWIKVVSTGAHSDLRLAMERLRNDFGIQRISAVGGRSAATALIDAGVVGDLYLTTSPISAGVPNTPLYTGIHPPNRQLAIRKETLSGVTFEHFVIGDTISWGSSARRW